jgi:hypothetical protein
MLPEGEGKARDLLDALVTGSQVERIVQDESGKNVLETVTDPRSTRVKLSHINSNTFGQAIYELMEWIRNGNDADKNMCFERAEALKKDVIEVGDSVWLSYDAKGSETIGINKENSQTNYIGMIGKNKQERVYSINDKKNTGRLDALFGKKVEDDD